MSFVIMDTGPLVARFCPKDAHHQWAMRVFDSLPSGVLVCEAVLAETCHLVAKDGVSPSGILRLVEQSDLVLVSLGPEIATIRGLIEQFANVPMDFADACLWRMAQMLDNPVICTTDTDFQIYWRSRPQALSLLAPFVSG